MSGPSCHDGTCVRRDLHTVPAECSAEHFPENQLMNSDQMLAELRVLCALWSPDTGLDAASTAHLVQGFMWLDNTISTGGYLPEEWDPEAWEPGEYRPTRSVDDLALPGAEPVTGPPETGPTAAPAAPPVDRQA